MTPLPDSPDTPADAFRRAVKLLGGQVLSAKMMGVTQGAISKRLRAQKPIWPEQVLAVEAATGVPRYELRPDIYPREEYARLAAPLGAGVNPANANDAADPLAGLRA